MTAGASSQQRDSDGPLAGAALPAPVRPSIQRASRWRQLCLSRSTGHTLPGQQGPLPSRLEPQGQLISAVQDEQPPLWKTLQVLSPSTCHHPAHTPPSPAQPALTQHRPGSGAQHSPCPCHYPWASLCFSAGGTVLCPAPPSPWVLWMGTWEPRAWNLTKPISNPSDTRPRWCGCEGAVSGPGGRRAVCRCRRPRWLAPVLGEGGMSTARSSAPDTVRLVTKSRLSCSNPGKFYFLV